MIRSAAALSHYHRRKGHVEDTPLKKAVDSLIYIIIGFGLIMTLPQLKNIWIDKNTEGVSAVSWGSYAFLNMFWLLYGILHREKPIIISSLAWIILQALIVIGILVH